MDKQKALSEKVWAVLGATSKKNKFGYKIYKHLKNQGYVVYAVNPGIEDIDGDVCYASLRDLPEKPGIVNFVVPESVGMKALEECHELDIKNVWLQPGADRPSVREKAAASGLNAIQGCVLVELR